MPGEPKFETFTPQPVEKTPNAPEVFEETDGIAGIIEKLKRMDEAGETIAGSSQTYTARDIAHLLNDVLVAAGKAIYQYDLAISKMVNDPASRYSLSARLAQLPEIMSITRSNGLRDAVAAGMAELVGSQKDRVMPRYGKPPLDPKTYVAFAELLGDQETLNRQ